MVVFCAAVAYCRRVDQSQLESWWRGGAGLFWGVLFWIALGMIARTTMTSAGARFSIRWPRWLVRVAAMHELYNTPPVRHQRRLRALSLRSAYRLPPNPFVPER